MRADSGEGGGRRASAARGGPLAEKGGQLRSEEIKRRFLEFFAGRGHRVVESSSLIPDDPTLLLTTAGMVQFKPYFLGEIAPEYTRATSAQKCLRTTDIDRVGYTARHLTFFEMLGNFSFGDYYKSEAARFAWDFLLGEMGLPLDRLYFTIYEEDEEAWRVWTEEVGVPEERVVRLGKEDNFWDMGVTGPCGPCSEIIYDQGPQFGCGRPECAVGCDCDRFLELWNLVFMQFNRDADGGLSPLPKKNIDTGMGLERLASVMQGVPTNFHTDLLLSLIQHMAGLAGVSFGASEKTDVSLRVVADHSRAASFLINDGVFPSNEDRGYILRRLIRRAVRHGRGLGVERPFMEEMVDAVVELMGESYPDLRRNRAFIAGMVRGEEERFLKTLRSGLAYLQESLDSLRSRGQKEVPGEVAFHLHDTLGFPLELTREMAAEQGLRLDEEGFAELMSRQKERARKARVNEGYSAADKEVYLEALDSFGGTVFDGYQLDEERVRILAVISNDRFIPGAEKGAEVEVVLDRTPFYGEMGGQVGDRGELSWEDGLMEVSDVQRPLKDLFVHRGRIVRGRLESGMEVNARVDVERRADIRRNHTATHLIHHALGEVLGEHARQAGSLVEPDRLRFDFTHFSALEPRELEEIEERVNSLILADLPVRAYFTTYEYACSLGAVALFGEKYGDEVRVVEVDEISRELCGGTHVARTGEIGMLLFTSEGSVGANLRRLEAVTGRHAYRRVRRMSETLDEASRLVKADPGQLITRLEKLLSKQREMEREAGKRSQQQLSDVVDAALREGERWTDGEVAVLSARVGAVPAKLLRDLAERVLQRLGTGAVILAAEGEKVDLVVAVSPELAEKGLNAVEMAKRASALLGGGAGGRPDMAVGGGTRRDTLGEALREARSAAASLLSDIDA